MATNETFKKMEGTTPDLTQQNIEKLKELFPEIITDGKIDFEKLEVILGKEIDSSPERYNFTWNGKKETMQFAQHPSKGTLRPVKEKSKDWDTTQNLYIEGDNLEVLKLLQKSYANKIKIIYIDPPYNTGNDFVYSDKFSDNINNYLKLTNQIGDDGEKLASNTESNGRYHTDWLNMMYSRIKLARNLLTNNGVIFISIDDNEVDKLKMICNELFGEQNFLAQIVWEKIHSIKNDAKYFSENHEYVIAYAKSIEEANILLLPRTEEMNSRYKNPDNDSRGPWQSGDLVASGERTNGHFNIKSPKTGKEFDVPKGKHWVYSEENLNFLIRENRIWFGKDGNSFPRKKRFLSEVQDGRKPSTIWKSGEVGNSQKATRELKLIFEGNLYFDFPKPVNLLKQIVRILTTKDDLVLDFFSGSSTTAHATMELNAEDGFNRKFIMVQLPEPLEESSDAYRDGYMSICDIGEERIHRAGDKIKQELIKKNNEEGLLSEDTVDPETLDIGFKVFCLDTSNISEWQADFEDIEQNIDLFETNFLQGRTELDIVYEVILKNGLDLTYPVDRREYENFNIYDVANGNLFLCLSDDITREVATEIVGLKKEYDLESGQVIFKDNGFRDDTEKLNAYEILKAAGYEDSDLMSI